MAPEIQGAGKWHESAECLESSAVFCLGRGNKRFKSTVLLFCVQMVLVGSVEIEPLPAINQSRKEKAQR
jgi:hypothetical protein